MGDHSIFLYDKIGNEYLRKNKYLLQLAELEQKIRKEGDRSKKAILLSEKKELQKEKRQHIHNQELKRYKNHEKEFKSGLKGEVSEFERNLPSEISPKIKELRSSEFLHKRRLDFYSEFRELTYEAEFKYEESKIYLEHIPGIIEFINTIKEELLQATSSENKPDPETERSAKVEFEQFKKKAKESRDLEIDRVKKSRKEGNISKKAEANGIREIRREFKSKVKLESYSIPSIGNKDFIRSKRIELRNGIVKKEKIIKADVADMRRKVPIEVEKRKPYIAWLTPLFPGFGQILNGQVRKSGFFFAATFFIYFIAIPYALGFGNYQGEGISGLFSLAQGGARIHKSLIFMIEGIVAILLVLIAAGLLYISFRDVLATEKNMIKGVRPPRWFETKRSVFQDGFPYVASLPAMLIILFVIMVPVITTLLLSFTNMNPQNQSKFNWIGIENYKLIAAGEGLAGSVFWLILVWTVIWTAIATTLAIFLGFFLAMLVNNDRIRGKKFFRTIYILPWAVPAFITIMFFSIMVAPDGIITQMLNSVFGRRIEIKNSTLLTRTALILMQGWLGSAYVFLLTTGVLQAIPSDLYEAADIDGASSFEKIRKITIPLVLFQIAPLLVTQYTFNFNNFSVIFLFNGGGPFNPQLYGNLAGSSDLLISYVYKLIIVNQYQAIAAAITVFISLGLMLFAFTGFSQSKGFKEGRL